MNFAEQPWQLTRFAVVGVFNTGLAYAIYFIFLHLGAVYWMANLVSLAIGIVISFLTQGSLVFSSRDPRRFGRFVLTWLGIYAIQTWAIGMLIAYGYKPSLSGVIVLPGTVMVSYAAQKYFVFGVRLHDTPPRPPGTGT